MNKIIQYCKISTKIRQIMNILYIKDQIVIKPNNYLQIIS